MMYYANHFAKFWHRQAVAVTLAVLISLAIMPRCLADEIPASDDNKIELCIEQLREAPLLPDPSNEKIDINGEQFFRLRVGDKQFSEKITNCLKEASQSGFNSIMHRMVDDFSYGTRQGDADWIRRNESEGVRYLYVDAYQRKYVLDLKAKRSYDLVRIPVPGSIESMATWTGTPVSGCKNSDGDLCGSTYINQRKSESMRTWTGTPVGECTTSDGGPCGSIKWNPVGECINSDGGACDSIKWTPLSRFASPDP